MSDRQTGSFFPFSYIQVEQKNVAISAVKKAEDGDDVIIRCYETDRVATAATIRLPLWGRTIEATFGPCEIKTFRVPVDPSMPVVGTSLLEWEPGEEII